MTFKEFRNLAVNLACGLTFLFFIHLGTSQGLPKFNQALSEVHQNLKNAAHR